MTQAQQQAIADAQAKFFAAEQRFNDLNAQSVQADAAYQQAMTLATSTLPQQQAAERTNAANAVQAAMQARTTAFNASGQAASDMHQAQIDYQNAIVASLQTGAVEDVSHTSQPLTA